jgi:purine-nucleoside phosphorylase
MTDGLFERAGAAAEAIRARVDPFPEMAVVLGSGLSGFVDGLRDGVEIDYEDIPNFPRPTVVGHRGKLVVGSVGAARVAALAGRFHWYEGHGLATVTLPVRALQRLGVRTLILSAAVGAVRRSLRPGGLVCLTDHINLLGANPLRGTNDDRLGTRFPDLSAVYSPWLRSLAHDAAKRLGIDLEDGVYAAVSGPTYETPSEVRMLGTLGADVVGMSTVPEAIVARHAGMEVLGLALVTNWAAGIAATPITHEEVLQAGLEAAPRFAALVREIVQGV